MRISRTILTLILAAAAVILKYFGIDIDFGDPQVPDGGWSLMEGLAWLLGILAAFFRVRATQVTNNLGVKTEEPLNG